MTNSSTNQTNSELPKSPDQFFDWPQKAAQEKNWQVAISRWSILRKAYPEHPTPWVQAAYAHLELSQFDEANKLLSQARIRFPNIPNAFIFSAEYYMRLHSLKEAAIHIKYCQDKFPETPQVWLKSSEFEEQQGNFDQALKFNEKARKMDKSLPAAYIQYAEIAMRANQWEKALIRWEEFRTKFPNHPTGYFRGAEAAINSGNPKLSRQILLSRDYGNDIPLTDIKKSSIHKGNKKGLKWISQIIATKAMFNLRSEVQRNYLSYSWWLLEPILHMTVYYIVFGLLLNRGSGNFSVFLLTGLIPWMWFLKAVSSSSNSVIAGQNLMLQVGLPTIIFPLVTLLQSTIKQIPAFLLLIGFVWFQGFLPGHHWWALIPLLLVQTILTITIACAVAAIIPFIRDLSQLVPTGLTFLMFLSGVFYDYRAISPEWQEMFLLNPIAFLLKSYREIFMEAMLPDLVTLAWWGGVSSIACILVLLIYMRLRYIFPRVVLE